MEEETQAQLAPPPPRGVTLSSLKPAAVDFNNLPAVAMGFGSLQSFELIQRAAKLLAGSTLIPQAYQGNLPNCVIALNMAQRMQADPVMVMQNLHVIAGRPSWSAQFLIACWNQCGRFTTMKYRWTGERGKDTWGCIAHAKEHSTRELVQGPEITIAIAKEEGWYGRHGSKWKTIPELMLMYRAAAFIVRTHAPELSLGLPTVEEAHDFIDVRQGADGAYAYTPPMPPPAQSPPPPPPQPSASTPPPPSAPLSDDVIRAERAERAARAARSEKAEKPNEEGKLI